MGHSYSSVFVCTQLESNFMRNPRTDRRFAAFVNKLLEQDNILDLGEVMFDPSPYKTFKSAAVGSLVCFPWFCEDRGYMVCDVWRKCRLNRWAYAGNSTY